VARRENGRRMRSKRASREQEEGKKGRVNGI
jgi:hypothetical protein